MESDTVFALFGSSVDFSVTAMSSVVPVGSFVACVLVELREEEETERALLAAGAELIAEDWTEETEEAEEPVVPLSVSPGSGISLSGPPKLLSLCSVAAGTLRKMLRARAGVIWEYTACWPATSFLKMVNDALSPAKIDGVSSTFPLPSRSVCDSKMCGTESLFTIVTVSPVFALIVAGVIPSGDTVTVTFAGPEEEEDDEEAVPEGN